jgi:hypothetical protein
MIKLFDPGEREGEERGGQRGGATSGGRQTEPEDRPG